MQQRQTEEADGNASDLPHRYEAFSAEQQSAAQCGITVRVAPTARIGAMCVDQIAHAIDRSPRAFLGTATGSTPHTVGFWKVLQQRAANGSLDLKDATFVEPDEWVGLPKGHPETYRAYLEKELTDHFPTNILVPDGNASDPIASAVEAEQAIVDGGGFAWMMLGMGINGHIGFFEPCADGVSSQPFTPRIDEINRQRYAEENFGSLDKVPTHATTIGMGTVMRSRHLCLVVVGQSKAEMLAKALAGPVTMELPASVIQLATSATVFLDEASASGLDLQALNKRPGWRVETE